MAEGDCPRCPGGADVVLLISTVSEDLSWESIGLSEAIVEREISECGHNYAVASIRTLLDYGRFK